MLSCSSIESSSKTQEPISQPEPYDTINEVIQSLDESKFEVISELEFFPIARKYVKLDNTLILDAPIGGRKIKVLNKTTEVLIYDRLNNWERISVEHSPAEWVESKNLCTEKNCLAISPNSDVLKIIKKSPLVKNTQSTYIKPKLALAEKKQRQPINNKIAPVNSCSCSVINYCVGPRGGHYCYTNTGNKRYIPR